MMKPRVLETSFIVLFAIMLLAPAIQTTFAPFSYEAVDEHRTKSERPRDLLIPALFSTDYAKDYERYFNDSYGLRDFFIKLKNQIDYSVFHRSDEVLIGKDDWLEYRSVGHQDVVQADRMTDEELESVVNRLERFAKFAREQGATLILLMAQTKFVVYPEFAPTSWPLRQPQTVHTRMMARLQAKNIPFVDATETLLKAKREHQVYYKSDFHWNAVGAFAVAGQLVDRLASLEDLPLRWHHPLRYTRQAGFVGGNSRSLAIFSPPKEDDFVITPTWEEKGRFEVMPLALHYNTSSEQPVQLLPSTWVLGNSYVDNYFQGTGFYSYFREARFLHVNAFSDVTNIPPGVKYVVLQVLEGNIGAQLRVAEWWPKAIRE